MKLLLDLGAHKLEGVTKLISLFDKRDELRVVCWEPNPFLFEETETAAKKFAEVYGVKVECKNVAASDSNGIISFNFDESKISQGCNTLETPAEVDVVWGTRYKWSRVEVNKESVREYLNAINEEVTDVYIKCDIEGAEFEVLPSILKSLKIGLVRKVFVEWHERYWHPNEQQKIDEKNRIIEDYNSFGIEVFEWE